MASSDAGRTRGARRRGWLIAGLVGVGLAVPGTYACRNYLEMALAGKRAEAVFNLEHIRQAQEANHQDRGGYLAAPASRELPGSQEQKVEAYADSSWQHLGWDRFETHRCRYEVTLVKEGGYLATAHCDGDGDGEYALYEAGPDLPPTRRTGRRVY